MNINVFEAGNARDIEPSVLAGEFIWTPTFQTLFSTKNQIILGARGTGKTAFAKMLSMEGLSKYKDSKAQKIIAEKTFIATYLPLKAEFTTKLMSINDNGNMQDFFFIWSINLSSCFQFTLTLEAIINSYFKNLVDKAKKEKEISIALSSLWLDKSINTLPEIRENLKSIEFKKGYVFNRVNFGFKITEEDFRIGEKFHSDLFTPIKQAIEKTKMVFNFSNRTSWSLCIDEAEILTESQWILLNTQMRAFSDIVFKITTMPYKHKTLKTHIIESLNPGHDFEYVYIDQLGTTNQSTKTSEQIIQNFAFSLFKKKIENSEYKSFGVTLEYLVGKSYLTDKSNAPLKDTEILNLIRTNTFGHFAKRVQSLNEVNNVNKENPQNTYR